MPTQLSHPSSSSGFFKSSVRIFGWGLAIALVFTGFSAPIFAQTSGKAAPVIEEKNIFTQDGWNIPITYFQSNQGKEASVVLLLHGEGENRLVWRKNGLAERLQAEGFAVVTCDLRKHGAAKNPRFEGKKELNAADFNAMASATKFSELEVIQDFLYEEHQAQRLNMAKYTIIAAGSMVPVALNWAANDWIKKPFPDSPTLATSTPKGQTVRGLVMLSPEENAGSLNVSKPLLFFSKLPGAQVSLLFISGTKESSYRNVNSMFKTAKSRSNAKVVYKDSYPTALKGTDLLGRIDKAKMLTTGFLKKELQERQIEWRSRKSKAFD